MREKAREKETERQRDKKGQVDTQREREGEGEAEGERKETERQKVKERERGTEPLCLQIVMGHLQSLFCLSSLHSFKLHTLRGQGPRSMMVQGRSLRWDARAIAGHCGTIALSYCTNKKDDVIYDALCVASLDNMPTDKSVIQIMAYGAVTHST